MSRKVLPLLVFVLLFASITGALANTPSVPVSDRGIVPYIMEGANQGGNITCEEVGDFMYSSERINYEGSDFIVDGISVTVTDGTYVSWSAPFGIGAVIVKGSNDANIYEYNPQLTWDSGLAAPPNASGDPAGLSNITFCWNPEEDPGQWCSPGYWRQDQHLDSWAATGYSPDDLFYDVFGYYPTLSNKGLTDGATTNPTLLQVLQSPQYYGGDAFNLIGDLLSETHPDVNFLGERVEDSCPLD
jgi:hypothetical protein